MKKKSGVTIFIPDKTDFKTKAISRDKEGPSNSSSGCLCKETPDTKLEREIRPSDHCSVTYRSQGRETASVSVNGRVDREVVHINTHWNMTQP